MTTAEAFDPSALLIELELALADSVLSDDERRTLAASVRQAAPPEDGLRQLRNRAFALARTQTEQGRDTLSVLKWLEGVVRALDSARAPAGTVHSRVHFSPGEDCLRAIRAQLRSARQHIQVCVFTISDDRISDELLAAHQRGVAVRLITDNDKELDAGSDVNRLRQAGIPTRIDRTTAHMHHKFALVDASWLLNGSYNWTRSAAQANEENLVVTNDPGLVGEFTGAFEALWGRLG